jgi:hypothetical protein
VEFKDFSRPGMVILIFQDLLGPLETVLSILVSNRHFISVYQHPEISPVNFQHPLNCIAAILSNNKNRFNGLCSIRRSVDDFVILEIIAGVYPNEDVFVFGFLSKMGTISPKLSKNLISESNKKCSLFWLKMIMVGGQKIGSVGTPETNNFFVTPNKVYQKNSRTSIELIGEL